MMIHVILYAVLVVVILAFVFGGNHIYKHWTDFPDDEDDNKRKGKPGDEP